MDRSHRLECSYEVAWGHLAGGSLKSVGQGLQERAAPAASLWPESPAHSPSAQPAPKLTFLFHFGAKIAL